MKTALKIVIISFAIIANCGCAGTRFYDNGKPAIATYGDSNGAWKYKSKTVEFSYTGTLDHSKPTKTLWDGVNKETTALGAAGVFLAH